MLPDKCCQTNAAGASLAGVLCQAFCVGGGSLKTAQAVDLAEVRWWFERLFDAAVFESLALEIDQRTAVDLRRREPTKAWDGFEVPLTAKDKRARPL